MSTRHLIQPEIKRMLIESRQRQSCLRYGPDGNGQTVGPAYGYENGYQDALREVEKLLLGIGVKVQSTTYPEQEETLVTK